MNQNKEVQVTKVATWSELADRRPMRWWPT